MQYDDVLLYVIFYVVKCFYGRMMLFFYIFYALAGALWFIPYVFMCIVELLVVVCFVALVFSFGVSFHTF